MRHANPTGSGVLAVAPTSVTLAPRGLGLVLGWRAAQVARALGLKAEELLTQLLQRQVLALEQLHQLGQEFQDGTDPLRQLRRQPLGQGLVQCRHFLRRRHQGFDLRQFGHGCSSCWRKSRRNG
jgi:hypothetical protein